MVCNESPSLFRHRCSEQQHQDNGNDVVDGTVFEKKRAHRHATLHHQETCYGVSGLRNERWELHLEFILDIRRILPPNGSCWASTKRPQVLRVSEIMFDTSSTFLESPHTNLSIIIELCFIFSSILYLFFVENSREWNWDSLLPYKVQSTCYVMNIGIIIWETAEKCE